MFEIFYLIGSIIFLIASLYLCFPKNIKNIISLIFLSLFSWVSVIGLIYFYYVENNEC